MVRTQPPSTRNTQNLTSIIELCEFCGYFEMRNLKILNTESYLSSGCLSRQRRLASDQPAGTPA